MQALLYDAVTANAWIGAQLTVLDRGVAVDAVAGVLSDGERSPVTTDSLFEIGSVTKPLVAAALLLAHDAGQVDLAAPVSLLVPEWRPQSGARDVTARQLLTHTSGVAGDFFPDTGSEQNCLGPFVELLAEQPPDLPPGLAMSYSNAGYVLAGRLLECATKMPFDTALTATLLAPAGAGQLRTWNQTAGRADVADGHAPTVEGRPRVTRRTFPRALTPAGGVISSAAALAALVRALTINPAGTGLPDWLPRRSRERLVPLTDRPAVWIGWGWAHCDSQGEVVLTHDGGTVGQSSFVRVLPDQDLVLVLLVNNVGVGDAAPQLLDRALDLLGHAPLEPAPQASDLPGTCRTASALTGRYRRAGGCVEVTSVRGELRCTLDVDDYVSDVLEMVSGPLILRPEGSWSMETEAGALPMVFLTDPGSPTRAAYCLAVGRGHTRVTG